MRTLNFADDPQFDHVDALTAADPGGMLRATADSGAQIRRALAAIEADALGLVAAEGRPRAVIVAGMGGSGISGDVLAAVCGAGCPVALSTLRGYTLPGWVGPLDLVIAVDTGIAHLAAALGRPVWMLLPFVPDWRWLLGRSDSPWYTSARLFRQEAPGDWTGVLQRVKSELTCN